MSARGRAILSLWSTLLLLTSCVDEFQADLPSSDTDMLVVEGSIVSGKGCMFNLSHTVALDGEYTDTTIPTYEATLTVRGSDGSEWKGADIGGGSFWVSVGTLDAQVSYGVTIVWKGRTYTSEMQRPIVTPEIDRLDYYLSGNGPYVDILLSTSAIDGMKTGESCYVWTCEECWEVNTPFKTYFDYDARTDKVAAEPRDMSRGWCVVHRAPLMGTNADYDDGAIAGRRLMQMSKDDKRFSTLYSILVEQRAISMAEYEYRNLLEKQSTGMGGLFTPQPTSLPGNITCESSSSHKAIGYVGVSAGVTTKRLFVSRKQAGYVEQRPLEYLTPEEKADYEQWELYAKNYRVYDIDPFDGPMWCARWCNDCTDPYWGVTTRTRPDFWPQ